MCFSRDPKSCKDFCPRRAGQGMFSASHKWISWCLVGVICESSENVPGCAEVNCRGGD